MVAIVSGVCLAGTARSQTFNSFQLAASLNDVTVEAMSPLSYRVSIGATPAMELGGAAFTIVDVFGFWVLSEDDDLVGAASDFGVWTANSSNASLGGILGWRTNPNTGLYPGESQMFTFESLETARVEHFGFKVRLDQAFPGTSGNTGFVYVPGPGAGVVLAGAGVIAARRRRVSRR